jgi:hypothetical protein
MHFILFRKFDKWNKVHYISQNRAFFQPNIRIHNIYYKHTIKQINIPESFKSFIINKMLSSNCMMLNEKEYHVINKYDKYFKR